MDSSRLDSEGTVAPLAVEVLFAWTHKAGKTYVKLVRGHHSRIEVVNPGTSAMMGLEPFLGVCSCGHFEFTPDGSDETVSPLLIEAALLGKPQTRVKSVSTVAHDSSIRLLDVAALAFATASYMHTDEMRDFCIWQRALVRKSSRPVDMVFSITGILGVMLDPSEFAADDRLGATIALAREILR